MRKWRIEDSEELYNIKGWGVNYFGINEKGHAYVSPRKDGVRVDLKEVVDELNSRDITAPVLLRFPDILDNRIEKTSECFARAAEEYEFKAEHFIIYPIKVNQMRPVVEEIISHGKKIQPRTRSGFQTSSCMPCWPRTWTLTARLFATVTRTKTSSNWHCWHKKWVNVCSSSSKRCPNSSPLPARPKSWVYAQTWVSASSWRQGTGKWQESGGDASKFGLNSSELLQALQKLNEMGMHDCLKLIHFHIGSQITKIRRISTALREAAQFYVQLHSLGFNIEFVDCGGGLGVDYDGTRSSNSESSVNYSIQNTSTTASTLLSMQPTKTTFRTRTSLPRVAVRSLPTTPYSLSTCLKM